MSLEIFKRIALAHSIPLLVVGVVLAADLSQTRTTAPLDATIDCSSGFWCVTDKVSPELAKALGELDTEIEADPKQKTDREISEALQEARRKSCLASGPDHTYNTFVIPGCAEYKKWRERTGKDRP